MAQDLDASVVTDIDSTNSRPSLLLEIYFNSGTLRYVNEKQNIVFPTGGNTYTAKAFSLGNKTESNESQLVTATLVIDNVDGSMFGYNNAERFNGKKIIIKKVYRNNLGNADYYRELFNGYMEEPHSIDKRWMLINIYHGKILQRKTLQKFYQRECNNKFGDTTCNYDGNADLSSATMTYTGTSDSGTTKVLIDSALSQTTDYWKFGRVEMGIGGVTYYRLISAFSAVSDMITFDIPMHIAISGSTPYTVFKGCPKTIDACSGTYAYGPSSDNSDNFAGFPEIGDANPIPEQGAV